jgi:hypothetical protein
MTQPMKKWQILLYVAILVATFFLLDVLKYVGGNAFSYVIAAIVLILMLLSLLRK